MFTDNNHPVAKEDISSLLVREGIAIIAEQVDINNLLVEEDNHLIREGNHLIEEDILIRGNHLARDNLLIVGIVAEKIKKYSIKGCNSEERSSKFSLLLIAIAQLKRVLLRIHRRW